jgi:nicotinate-nucleotide pyrophosphorylase (carboxylating)
MNPFSFRGDEIRAAKKLIKLACEEDVGGHTAFLDRSWADITSGLFIPAGQTGKAAYVARSAGVLSGQQVCDLVYHTKRHFAGRATYEALVPDGSRLEGGTVVGRVSGEMRAILGAERITLNFLQHLSGVATLTRQFVDRVAGLPCRILDTRKTTPGWRVLEKYAVRCGGGTNLRMGLHDGILIKDNHLSAMAASAAPVSFPHGGMYPYSHPAPPGQDTAPPPRTFTEAVAWARRFFEPGMPVEVEVDTLEQVDQALPSGADIVLLDNMNLDQLREAVGRRNAVAPSVLLEASGGVNLQTVRAIAETGVDRISVGALTHSAVALDIGLDYLA